MATRMSDSRMYSHLWTAPELEYLFEERARLNIWLRILIALAQSQAELGLIPAEAAVTIATEVNSERLDLDRVAVQTRLTSHSMLGLIDALSDLLPASAHQFVYYGATVQDVTDTWFGIVMRDVGELVLRQLRSIEAGLLELATTHRDTVMAGRTHGQLGAPITFGTKVAAWADEVGRHCERVAQAQQRWSVGQLAGAVGVLAFFHPHGPELRRRFCGRLGLGDPGMSWLTSRDRLAEFGHVMAMVCGTLARIGNEVYELQRPEIAELAERRIKHGVSSITMPHKRNPEASEHLGTLSRLVRAHAAVLLEGMDQQHERDGRGWKAEWIALPETCELSVVALNLADSLIGGLEVNSAAMTANLEVLGSRVHSEQILAGLSRHLGKHQAQRALQQILASPEVDIRSALLELGVREEELQRWLATPSVGSAGDLVDAVVVRARSRSTGAVT